MVPRRYIFILVFAICLFTPSCKSPYFHSFTEGKQRNKVQAAITAVANSDKEKVEAISKFASGTDYALSKATNSEPAIEVAKDINQRVISLAGEPQISAKKEMWALVDKLTSDLITERVEGRKLLNQEDKKVQAIQTKADERVAKEKTETKKYMDLAQETAKKADASQAELSEYKGWLGLKAVGKGLKQFLFSSMWILLGVGILFLVLRGFAGSNPIIGAFFSIFEQIGAWIVHGVRLALPKAVSFAKFVPQAEFNDYKNTLKDAVQVIQKLKISQSTTPATLEDLLAELDKKFDDADKSRIDIIKKELNWR